MAHSQHYALDKTANQNRKEVAKLILSLMKNTNNV